MKLVIVTVTATPQSAYHGVAPAPKPKSINTAKNLRDNFDDIKKMLSSRGYNIDEDSFKSLDKKRKVLQVTVEDLQADRKKLSSEFGKLKASGESVDELKTIIDETNTKLDENDKELQSIYSKRSQ